MYQLVPFGRYRKCKLECLNRYKDCVQNLLGETVGNIWKETKELQDTSCKLESRIGLL